MEKQKWLTKKNKTITNITSKRKYSIKNIWQLRFLKDKLQLDLKKEKNLLDRSN